MAHLGVDTHRFAELVDIKYSYLRLITSGQKRSNGSLYDLSRPYAKKIEESKAIREALPQLPSAWMERPHWQDLPPAENIGLRTTAKHKTLDAPTRLRLRWASMSEEQREAFESLLGAFDTPKSDRDVG